MLDSNTLRLFEEEAERLIAEDGKVYAGEGQPGDIYDEADVAELNRLGWRWNDLHETWEHDA